MNKKAIICTVAILILLVGASVIYFIMDRSSEAETENSSSMSAAELESSNSPLETSSEAPTESEPKESAYKNFCRNRGTLYAAQSVL